MIRTLLGCLCALLLLGCAAKNSRSAHEMTEGERLYRANCASCHSLRNPADYTDEQWVKYVAKYGEKLNLSEEKQAKILSHLQSSN